ncbi:MAG: tetratricopeptide repeat protein [Cyclobacteriaceae bacterium]
MFQRLLLITLFGLSFSLSAQEDLDFDTIRGQLESLSVSKEVLDSINQMAFGYWNSQPDITEKYGRFTLKEAEKLNYRKGIANSNSIIGTSLWARNVYDQALEHFLTALTIFDELGEKRRKANVLSNIGNVYDDQQLFQKSLDYHRQAIPIFNELRDTLGLARVYNNMGVAAKHNGQLDSALHFYSLSLAKRYEMSDSVGIARVLNNLGVIKEQQDDYNSGLEYALQALTINTGSHDLNLQASILENAGGNLRRLGQLALAEAYLDSAMRVAKVIDTKYTQILVLEELKELEQAQGNYKQALEYMNQFVELNQLIFSEQSQNRIDRLELQYKTLLKEKELSELRSQQTENRLIRNIALVLVASILIIAFLIINRQRLKIKQNKKLLDAEKEIAQKDAENASLRENELKVELEQKQRELASYALNFVQKGQLMEELKDKIDELRNSVDSNEQKHFNKLIKVIDGSSYIDREWEDFKLRFEEVHHDFLQALKHAYPDLSTADLRICALLKLNMNMKEAARVLGISPDSVKISRYRLRKKLGLSTEDNLNDFILNFGMSVN